MAELKSCPFGPGKIITGYHGDEDGGYGYVECRCPRVGPLDSHCKGAFVGVHASTEEEAIAAWNRRAAEPPEAVRVLEALKPFASVGQWLFANPEIPDETVMFSITGMNGYHGGLTRGMFKAAHRAVRAYAERDGADEAVAKLEGE